VKVERSKNDFSIPVCMPFNDGVILAANAIPDTALVLDSPDCSLQKIENLYGNHDWLSDLCRISTSRFFTPGLQLAEIAMGDSSKLAESIKQAAATPGISALLLTAVAVVSITDKNYLQMVRDLELDTRLLVCDLTQGDLHRDWLDGYAETLIKLAENLPPAAPDYRKDENSVAVVGYLMDRNEGDHVGNLREIRSLLEGLGLKPVSIWLSGSPVTDLTKVWQAGSIISLPYGRHAAQILSERSGARLIEAPLPMGLDGTTDFLRTLGAAFGLEDRAEALIRSGERETLPKLRMVLPRWFMEKDFVLVTDPHLAEPLADTLLLFGCRPQAIFVTAKPGHSNRNLSNKYGVDVIEEPTSRQIETKIATLVAGKKLDFVLGSTTRIPVLAETFSIIEFGFPSHFTHHLVPMPFMGYGGVLGLAERIANRLAYDEQLRSTAVR